MVKSGLVISYYFPPRGGGGVQRWAKFIKYLSNLDWQFTVITKSPSQSEIIDKSLLKDIPEKTKILTTKSPAINKLFALFNSKSNYIFRWLISLFYITDSRKSWIKSAWKLVKKELNSEKYDVIICSIPPYTASDLAVKIKNNYSNIPVILDLRDPWSINPYKIYPTAFHKYLDKKKELKNIKKMDGLISAYQSTLDYYYKTIKETENKFNITISNGYDDDDFINIVARQLKKPEYFNIAFSGSFYSHLNYPHLLFESIAKLKKEGFIIIFHHVGSSVYDVKALSKKYDIEDQIVLWGYRNHNECLEILKSMDAFIFILDSKYTNADKTLGGKVYEYLKFNKPILGLVPKKGEAAELIDKTMSGVICESSNTDKIAVALKNLKSAEFKYKNIEEYSRKNLAIKLNDYLEKIINKNFNA